MDIDVIGVKLFLGLLVVQNEVIKYDIEFWIDKSITIAVLLWLVRDLKQTSKETTRMHTEQLEEKDKQHREQMKSVHASYKEVIETMQEQHTQQLNFLKDLKA